MSKGKGLALCMTGLPRRGVVVSIRVVVRLLLAITVNLLVGEGMY
jgi:hypothetical protein